MNRNIRMLLTGLGLVLASTAAWAVTPAHGADAARSVAGWPGNRVRRERRYAAHACDRRTSG